MGTILPGLDALFLESRNCVEQRVLKDLYPAFVKYKLALATTASLASPSRVPEDEYPGLASAFCITDAQDRDRIQYASDDFGALLGRSHDEIIHRNVAALHGATDPEAALCVKHAMSKERECAELVVGHRKDGEAFWNLVYVYPIPSQTGARRRCCLHSYTSVSDKIKSSTDILKLLGNETFKAEIASKRSSMGSARSGRSGRSRSSTSGDQSDDGRTSSWDKDTDRSRSRSALRFFNPFRRPVNVPPASQHNRSDSALAGPGGFPEPPLLRFCEDRVPSSPQPEIEAACGRLLLLRHQAGVKPKLLVSFASPSALEILNPTITLESIQDKDIFKVLSEEARSPSVTKSFRSYIRKGVLKAGERVTSEMLLGETRMRTGSVISLPKSSGWCSDGGRKERRGPMQLNCFWTPLKGDKAVEWVVLVLVPCC